MCCPSSVRAATASVTEDDFQPASQPASQQSQQRRLSVVLCLSHSRLLLLLLTVAALTEVSLAKKHDLFDVLDVDHDGLLSAEEQHGVRSYLREE